MLGEQPVAGQLQMMSGYAGMKGVPMPKVAVMFSGFLIIVGGLLVLLGFHPRYGLACIILFLAPVSLMIHTFWSDTDPMQKLNNQVNFGFAGYVPQTVTEQNSSSCTAQNKLPGYPNTPPAPGGGNTAVSGTAGCSGHAAANSS